MSQINQLVPYQGFWIDWTEGKFQGATWTLSHRDGALLQSFTAIFTTFVFAQLWSIIAFALHHVRTTRKAEDGLNHQQQAVFRNAGALASAVIFAQQIFYWRGRAERAFIRCLGWLTVALCFAAAAGLASTFSGYAASKSSHNRLVVSDNCGYTTYTDGSGQVNGSAGGLGVLGDTVTSANYARACYNNSTNTPEQCKRYIQPRLNWTATYNTTCPFQSGICSNGDQASFTLMTEPIDSLTGLGINSPPSERLFLQKRMTCSSIREVNNYNQSGNLVYYTFGPVGGLQNITFVYNRLARGALVSYSLSSTYSWASFPSTWSPVQALNRTDADVTIVFISSNNVYYSHSNNDPIFSATKTDSLTGLLYAADYDVSTLACAEQYQVCNPAASVSSNNSAACSPWMGAAQFLFQADYLASNPDVPYTTIIPSSVNLWKKADARLSATQLAILERITWVLPQTSTYNAISTRRASALRLEESLFQLVQTKALPDTYWTSELGWWFDACLARLQEGIMDFAIGPTNAAVNNSTYLPPDGETKKLCENQITRDVGDSTINFSVLALSIIYFVGITIIILSLCVERLSKMIYKRFWPQRAFKAGVWEANGFMHLLRTAFTAANHRGTEDDEGIVEEHPDVTWTSGSVPVTTQRVKMVHFSIPSSPSYTRLSTELQTMGRDDRAAKDNARVAMVAS